MQELLQIHVLEALKQLKPVADNVMQHISQVTQSAQVSLLAQRVSLVGYLQRLGVEASPYLRSVMLALQRAGESRVA